MIGRMRLCRLAFACIFAGTSVPASARHERTPVCFHQVHDAMGTVFSIDLYAADAASAAQLADKIATRDHRSPCDDESIHIFVGDCRDEG